MSIDTTKLSNICIGLMVDIIADKDKGTENITRGCVLMVISNRDNKKGIRVKLTNGFSGRVVDVPLRSELKTETFKFYNLFFYQNKIYGVWDKTSNKFLVLNRMNKINNNIERTILLFSSENEFINAVKGTSLDNRNYILRPISRKKSIVEFFKDYKIEYFVINSNRKLKRDKLEELEKKFKSC